VAQKRQRSKQRQAERRAERLAQRGGDGADSRRAEAARQRDPERQELEENVDLEVGAPPEDLGQSEFTTRHAEPPPPDFEIDDEELADGDAGSEPPRTRGPRGHRGDGDGGDRGRGGRSPGGAEHRERGRVLEFLKAVWAELQRVQWPNRTQLVQLTGVVLFFVVIVGAYLGALDAIFSKLIQSIL
jgi:preprotein translocase subunit SecE